MPSVTDHAILRYLERVDGIDMRLVRRQMQDLGIEGVFDYQVLDFLSENHGVDTFAVRQKLMTPDVVRAIAAGASRVRSHGVTIVLGGDKVITVHKPQIMRGFPIRRLRHLAKRGTGRPEFEEVNRRSRRYGGKRALPGGEWFE